MAFIPKAPARKYQSNSNILTPFFISLNHAHNFNFLSNLLHYNRKIAKVMKTLIEKSLKKILPRQYTHKSLSAITGVTDGLDVNAINQVINQPIWDLLDRGGKRWRPMLFLTIVELLGKDPRQFVDLATVFEVIHNGTLIVDDFEDLSEYRRGKKTIHLIYGNDVAINAGNLIYFLPLKIMGPLGKKIGQKKLLQVYQTYLDEMVNLGFGQSVDIAWHRGLVDGKKIHEKQYLQMCAFKTGGLARMACKIAAIVGGADEKLIAALGKLGESLGVVFQIQDDVLNITENKLSEMKGLGDDITEGKRSLPVILALKNLPPNKTERLIDILLLHTRDAALILEAISLIKEGKGIEKSEEMMKKLFQKAWDELDQLLPESEKKEELYKLSRFLIERQS